MKKCSRKDALGQSTEFSASAMKVFSFAKPLALSALHEFKEVVSYVAPCRGLSSICKYHK